MKRVSLQLIIYSIICTGIYGCAGNKQTVGVGAELGVGVDPLCTVSVATFNNHIAPRHCAAVPLPGVNQLLPIYCVNAASAQVFCRMVQAAPNQIRVVQPDRRVRYDSNLGVVVGTAGEKCGRLIITSAANGDVVTEFPETANAPPNCL